MSKQSYFGQDLFAFLTELKENNDRAWFQANKSRYEAQVRNPVLRFITDFAPHLKKISGAFVADARPNGGSLFRINRDTRFSKDKSPYKTAVGAYFKHESGKEVHAPGFYIHLDPDGSFLGVGIWHPDTKTLGKIRDAIVEDGAAWRRITLSKAFSSTLVLTGDKLKRPPQGYAADHPLIEHLKLKDFTTVTALKNKDVCGADFMQQVVSVFREAAPFNRFLTQALDLSW